MLLRKLVAISTGPLPIDNDAEALDKAALVVKSVVHGVSEAVQRGGFLTGASGIRTVLRKLKPVFAPHFAGGTCINPALVQKLCAVVRAELKLLLPPEATVQNRDTAYVVLEALGHISERLLVPNAYPEYLVRLTMDVRDGLHDQGLDLIPYVVPVAGLPGDQPGHLTPEARHEWKEVKDGKVASKEKVKANPHHFALPDGSQSIPTNIRVFDKTGVAQELGQGSVGRVRPG